MKIRFWVMILTAFLVFPLVFSGCKDRVRKEAQEPGLEMTDTVMPAEEVLMPIEPAQTIATETIPPTAAPTLAVKPVTTSQQTRDKDIQRALKSAGFYAGAIDGKIGPKTKKAIMDFQKSKGLKVDGKVGPKTWAELERYLVQ